MSGAQNEATAMAFGGPRSSCVRPGAHSARHQDSHKDWTPYRMAEPTRGSSLSACRLRSLAFLCSSHAWIRRVRLFWNDAEKPGNKGL